MNQKSILFTISFACLSFLVSCHANSETNREKGETTVEAAESDSDIIITDKVVFCESTYPLKDRILIANFGTKQLNPLNTEGKGYILSYKDGNTQMLIPADGNLSAPKGMFEKDNYLFICDVNKIVVYNLSDLAAAPSILAFPKDNLFVNDLAAKGNTLYASVTDAGKIYQIDISDMKNLNRVKPIEWCAIDGPNGLLIDGNKMYVASYPPDGKTSENNVVYLIPDLNQPLPEKCIEQPGQYDGLTLSRDKKILYVTNWNPAGMVAVDLESRIVTPVVLNTEVTGPADMCLSGDMLYIPDLPGSRVIGFSLK